MRRTVGISHDVIAIGAGAAGLFFAANSGKRGLRVLVLERAARPGLKILISGGGRANFTNRTASAADYRSENPHFAKSALARFTPSDFIAYLDRHRIPYIEKNKGKLFCARSAKDLLDMLLDECRAARVDMEFSVQIQSIQKTGDDFVVKSEDRSYRARRLVIATGGLSYPRLGASDFGYRVARDFGHRVIPPRPALTPMRFTAEDTQKWGLLSGVSAPVLVSLDTRTIDDELLFTHTGLSGPAILRASLDWKPKTPIAISFYPSSAPDLLALKQANDRRLPKNILSALPARLAEQLCSELGLTEPLPHCPDKKIRLFIEALRRYRFDPAGLEGFDKAEVTAGGVDTRELSSQTLESTRCPGLFFIGEVLDVTGDLGGYNFQWAWASAHAAAEGIPS